MTAGAQMKEDQNPATAQSEAGQQLQTPKINERQGHLDSHRKEHVSPAQALNLVQAAKKITGESLPIIPLPDGSTVQIVTLSSGKFFLCHNKQDGTPINYNFNKKGTYEDAAMPAQNPSKSKTYRETSQELLQGIKEYLGKQTNDKKQD